ncbi:FAD-dependent thymidylate synthase [Candidatus Babeliales bacterium]|nr:FAD-dependent thymidylate synthase [Candidatus Babeliales bacterium]
MGDVSLMAITPNAEYIIANAARHTFGYTEPINDPEKVSALVKKLIDKEHHSPLEHGSATVQFKGISRATSHQLVRHRLCSFTQKSDRYTKSDPNFDTIDEIMIVPPSIDKHSELYLELTMKMHSLYDLYYTMLVEGIKPEDARYILPCGKKTDIVVTANFRQWRHIFKLRGNAYAQWEIRNNIIEAWKILVKEAPNVFYDFSYDKDTNTICKPTG